METSQKVFEQVTAEINSRGLQATLEYPGFILCDGIAFGTANGVWGWDNSWLVSPDSESGEFTIQGDSTDVQAIADAIVSLITFGRGHELDATRDNVPYAGE